MARSFVKGMQHAALCRRIALVAAAVLACMLLAACAGTSSSGGSNASSSQTSSSVGSGSASGSTDSQSSASASSASGASSASSSANSTKSSSSGDSQPAKEVYGVSVLKFKDDEKVAKLLADMEAGDIPTKCNVLYDTMGARPDVDVTDPAQIKRIYDALSKVTVVAKSDMSVTDSYHHVYFTLQDGTTVGFSFEGEGLLSQGRDNYQVSGDADLWSLVRRIQDESMSNSDKNAWHNIKVASGEDMIANCPSQAKAGETVGIQTLDVTDGDLEVRVNGKKIEENIGMGIYVFDMPDQDVTIDVVFVDYPYGGA